MLRSVLLTLKNVAIALKNPHDGRAWGAVPGGMVRRVGRGKRDGAVKCPPASTNMQQTCQLPRKEKENNLAAKGTLAEKTGWESSVWVCCCLGSFPISFLSSSVFGRQASQGNVTSSGTSRHRPRQVHRIQPLRLKWGRSIHAVTCITSLLGVRQDPEFDETERGVDFVHFRLPPALNLTRTLFM